MVILLFGSRPRTRTLEQRQVRATSSATLLLVGASRPAVLETNCKPLIPFGLQEIGFVW